MKTLEQTIEIFRKQGAQGKITATKSDNKTLMAFKDSKGVIYRYDAKIDCVLI